MAGKTQQIIPIGGGGFYRDPENLELEKYVIRQSGAENARVAFVPTASGEPDHYVASFYAAFLKARLPPIGADVFQAHAGAALVSARSGRDLRRRRQHQESARSVARLGRGGNSPRGVAVGHCSNRRERRGDLLVRAGPDRFFFRRAPAAGLPGLFAGKLLPALRRRSPAPAVLSPALDGGRDLSRCRHRRLDRRALHRTEIHKVITSKRGSRAYSMRAVYGSIQEVPLQTDYLGSLEVS